MGHRARDRGEAEDGGLGRLAADLRAEFPDMRGFSGRNLRDMKRFHLAYSNEEFWRQAVAKSPGGRAGRFPEQPIPELPPIPETHGTAIFAQAVRIRPISRQILKRFPPLP